MDSKYYKGTHSPRNKRKKGEIEASLASAQPIGGHFEPIKLTKHNFVVEDNRKDTRHDIVTISFGTGGQQSLGGTRGSNEKFKKRWMQD